MDAVGVFIFLWFSIKLLAKFDLQGVAVFF